MSSATRLTCTGSPRAASSETPRTRPRTLSRHRGCSAAREPPGREQLRGGEPPDGAPPDARVLQPEEGVGAVPHGVEGVGGGAAREVILVLVEDLAHGVRRRDDDGEDRAEAERHDGAVAVSEAREGAVLLVALPKGKEVADERLRRPWAGWKAAARIGEQLEDVQGEEDETNPWQTCHQEECHCGAN